MFNRLVSYQNIKEAYLEIVEQFSADSRQYKYRGADSLYPKDFDYHPHDLITKVQTELLEKRAIDPVLSVSIPKRNKPGEWREIFIYNFKERVKAQAVSRVLLPEFEKRFSPRLFSYRPNKSPHLAAKLYSQNYRRRYKDDHALIIDLKNYTDTIDRKILLEKLQAVFSDSNIIDILKLFIFNDFYRDGVRQASPMGIVLGSPLVVLFSNLYLTDFDYKYQKAVEFYIRVGDDIAILDRDFNKLQELSREIFKDLSSLSVEVNKDKLFCGPARALHSYLGYFFQGGVISLLPSYTNRLLADWRRILRYRNLPEEAKDKLFRGLMFKPESNFNEQFKRIIREKPQINNSEQVRKLSEDFFKILTKFFYNKYSSRQRRLLKEKLKTYQLKSLYQVYKEFHYEKPGGTNSLD